jgi:hypothetical protein
MSDSEGPLQQQKPWVETLLGNVSEAPGCGQEDVAELRLYHIPFRPPYRFL